HDALTQSLFGLRLRLEAGDVGGARAVLDDIFVELRSLILQLRPPELSLEGLVPSLAKHLDVVGRAHALATSLEADAVPPLDTAVEEALFRIAQEALTNVVRHAQASAVRVALTGRDGSVALAVRDDGRGFDPAAPAISARRLGLSSMRERAEAVGGVLRVDAAPGAGTTVRAEVPAR